MKFTTKQIDEANIFIEGSLSKEVIDKNLNKVAKQTAKTLDIQGFRKGKVPVSIVKQRYSKQLTEDAQNDSIKKVLDDSLKELNIKQDSIIGEPAVSKFDKKENGDIEIEIKVSCKPNIDLGDYKTLIPEVTKQVAKDEEVDDKINELAKSSAPLGKIKRKRAAKENDFVIIDFEGFVDGIAFEGGKAEKYTLEIGSNSFIPGFEEQLIGMNYEEQKDITINFPKEYQSKDLAGKEAVFKITFHEIHEKTPIEINDEFAKSILKEDKDAILDTLKSKIQEQIQSEKTRTYYKDELKPKYLETLTSSLSFALPQSVVDQEVNHALNEQVKSMNEDEIKILQNDNKKVDELRDALKENAHKSVKTTFIVDALAKSENVDISDQEVSQIIYYEAMQTGQNPQDVLKQYQDAGYLPVIKMSLIEEKVITKLFDEKLTK